ncbi:hemerythrin domain-containing protein [Streptomyces marincola]|uniref:Hemerythrin n=1 Tax=Streptomyces marincola TaxID=2878388 RepID=A0A1W7D2I1_9ACTN|nr:hemerythrin domain-containing protein [Streptomyces marincola]ARQ71298.1 hemerythrin [Streptomyces marincola]
MGHGGDIIRELATDHREVEDAFRRIEALPPGHEERKELADRATIELIRHSIAEEQYLYPAVREHVPDGDRIADKEIEDHATAERLMKDLERHEATDPEFDRLIGRLMMEIREHVRDEEDNLFPMLRQSCSQDRLEALGDKARRAKSMAPTRPHPAAPDRPPLNKILAPGTGLVDRARDALSGRGKD